MRIVQAVWGVFHHFELARELEQRRHLQQIYSTFPWTRLKREGLSHSKVRVFPYLHMAYFIADRYFHGAFEQLNYANALVFDAWVDRQLRHAEIDAFISLSGVGLKTGKRLRQRGTIFICDRGSTHQRYQEQIVHEEFRRWGVDPRVNRARNAMWEREVAMYDAADAITVPSSFAARSFAEWGIAKDKLHVIPYGVRLEKFHRVAEPPSDTFEVLFVGQVGLRKGIPYLLQAFAGFRHSQKRLRIVGSVQPHLRDLLRRFPQDLVEFLGVQPQVEVVRYMSSSHVMVLPSIEEGLALVLGQAMACGCPVIASTNTGAEDLFSDGVEGFIVPIRDPDALKARIQQLADDPALQRSMSEAALRRVQNLGGWRQYGDHWVTLLERLLPSNRRS
jgi:glycosyltransferase involved in cell wall biosynthesis